MLIAMKPNSKNTAVIYLYVIQTLTGLVWLKSAVPKFLEPTFMTALPKTLTFFASKNPLPWYKQFLETVVIPNANLFGELSRLGEITAAILLIFTGIAAIKQIRIPYFHKLAALGAIIGAWLNLQFGLASYWTSPANETVNLFMFLVQFILILYHRELSMMKKNHASI